jgi:uncharacterized membrane protein
MATVVNPYRERRTTERRRLAHSGAYSAARFSAEGVRVSWGGIFGGVLAAVGLLLLLGALGLAVGISAVDPQSTELATLSTGAAIWTGVSLLLALFLGGMVATRLGATFDRTTSFFSGFLVWVVSLLVVAYLAASGVSSLAGSAFSMMGGAEQVIEQMQAQELPTVEEVKPQATRAAWVTFGALLLSLGAAVGGAMAGRRRQPISTGT